MNENRIFVDSNVILYLFGDDEKRKQFALSLLNPSYLISTQVVIENVNVCIRKYKIPKEEAFCHGEKLLNSCTLVNLYKSTILSAFKLLKKYGFSFWDSFIVSTALESKCDILYSEDMQDGLIVENKLVIINPFKKYKEKFQ